MPSRALYYPEWAVNDPRFLFESLLYWERIGCIVPYPEFKPWRNVWSADSEMAKVLAEANKLFVTPCYPTDEQKKEAHLAIEKFGVHRAPHKLSPKTFVSGERAAIATSKLARKTVELLRRNDWMRDSGLDMNDISSAAGNLVMGALACACSSDKMPPVTDDSAGFSASCNLNKPSTAA